MRQGQYVTGLHCSVWGVVAEISADDSQLRLPRTRRYPGALARARRVVATVKWAKTARLIEVFELSKIYQNEQCIHPASHGNFNLKACQCLSIWGSPKC
jgi:hypothetical protein